MLHQRDPLQSVVPDWSGELLVRLPLVLVLHRVHIELAWPVLPRPMLS